MVFRQVSIKKFLYEWLSFRSKSPKLGVFRITNANLNEITNAHSYFPSPQRCPLTDRAGVSGAKDFGGGAEGAQGGSGANSDSVGVLLEGAQTVDYGACDRAGLSAAGDG